MLAKLEYSKIEPFPEELKRQRCLHESFQVFTYSPKIWYNHPATVLHNITQLKKAMPNGCNPCLTVWEVHVQTAANFRLFTHDQDFGLLFPLSWLK